MILNWKIKWDRPLVVAARTEAESAAQHYGTSEKAATMLLDPPVSRARRRARQHHVKYMFCSLQQ